MKKMVLLWLVIISCVMSMSSSCLAGVEGDSKLKGASVAKEQTEKDIFSFKKEIGLTDEQENKIKASIYDIQQSLGANKSKLDILTNDLSRMIKNKEDMGKIRKKLEEISKIQVDSTCIDIENGRKINNVLSADQIKKWNDIKVREARTR